MTRFAATPRRQFRSTNFTVDLRLAHLLRPPDSCDFPLCVTATAAPNDLSCFDRDLIESPEPSIPALLQIRCRRIVAMEVDSENGLLGKLAAGGQLES